MAALVIDSNVLLVADGRHPQASPFCQQRCIDTLARVRLEHQVVLDEQHLLLDEYLHKLQPLHHTGPGSDFLNWLLHQQDNPQHVQWVNLHVLGENDYAEFPDDRLAEEFDPADRKFVAVAHAHPEKPNILQATDCKWLDWWPQLQANGIDVEFVCADDICRFYQHKFPDVPLPALPETS